MDIESKKQIDLKDYDGLIESVTVAREEFKKWYPNINYPIRCDDVFETYRKMNSPNYDS